MGWVAVNSKSETPTRFLRDSEIVEIHVHDQKNITFIDRRGNSFSWKTTGTVADYAKLVKLLGFTDVA